MATARGVYSRVQTNGERRWYVRIMIEGKYQRFSPFGGFLTEKDANAFALQARADIQRGKFFPEQFLRERLPLKDLLPDQTSRIVPSPNTKNDRQYQRWWLAHYPELDARTLTAATIDQARHRLAQEKKSPQTIHHYLKFLRHRLNLALRDGLIRRTPFAAIKLPDPKNMRVRFYSEDERQKLYAALDDQWRDAAELAGLTGLRWAEQFQLTREQINLKEGFVWLPSPKGGTPQARLLSRRAQELIRRQLARHDSAFLYPSEHGKTPLDYSNWRKRHWAPACKAAKIKDAKWNDWRHTFASDLTMAGHSDRTVADLMGHRSTAMVQRYAHLSSRHLRHAIEGLANPQPKNASVERPTAARPGSRKKI